MGKGDKEIQVTDKDGTEAKVPSVATSAEKPGYIVSDAIRAKINILYPDGVDGNTERRKNTFKALEAGKEVYIGAHKFRAARAD
jgi:hypothetical protein